MVIKSKKLNVKPANTCQNVIVNTKKVLYNLIGGDEHV